MIMTPKEKAVEIVDKFRDEDFNFEIDVLNNAKFNSLIAIDIILELDDINPEYWENVKIEIENL